MAFVNITLDVLAVFRLRDDDDDELIVSGTFPRSLGRAARRDGEGAESACNAV